MKMEIDKTKPVLVTGATGYVAGWVVKKLLDEGINVHAAVREPNNSAKIDHLEKIAKEASGEIKFFKTDLLDEGSYDEAMKGCELVFHTASPFILGVKDVQRDLIDPALRGTANVLQSANRTESVKRVVVTSSCAAIYGDNIDLENTDSGVFTEEDWNMTSNESHQPYSYSKLLAEKEAWRIVGDQNRWDLVVVNPSFVVGPGTIARGTSESFKIVKQMGDGTMRFGAPDFRIGAVDVRDLADAHFKAAYTPEAKGRYIVSAVDTSFLELADYLRKEYKQYPLPKKLLPKFMVWLLAPASGMKRKEVSLSVGYPWKADNSKGIKELGIEYRDMSETMTDMFQQLIDSNQL